MANLWDTPGVPHKGWTCTNSYDLGDSTGPGDDIEYHTCEMCGNEHVRYVHVMSHPQYQDLEVGCVCAEKMSDSYAGEYKKREKPLRSKAASRKRWLSRKWRRSANGNATMKLGDEWLTVMPSKFKKGMWIYVLAGKFSSSYPTEDAAKLALFDAYWEASGGTMGRGKRKQPPDLDW